MMSEHQIHPHARFRVFRTPDGSGEEEVEGIFVLQEQAEVVIVNDVGAFVVEQLKAGRSVAETVAAVGEHFEVEGDHDPAADVPEFIAELVAAGAIEELSE